MQCRKINNYFKICSYKKQNNKPAKKKTYLFLFTVEVTEYFYLLGLLVMADQVTYMVYRVMMEAWRRPELG